MKKLTPESYRITIARYDCTYRRPGGPQRTRAQRLAGIVGQQILLRYIGDVLALRVFREQMVERLILARPDVGRNGVVPFIRVVELGIDIEHHAAERKDAVADDLADSIFGRADLINNTDLIRDCGARQMGHSSRGSAPAHIP